MIFKLLQSRMKDQSFLLDQNTAFLVAHSLYETRNSVLVYQVGKSVLKKNPKPPISFNYNIKKDCSN